MFKDLKFTLYDFFGYLLPGTIFIIAIAILFWTIYFPNTLISYIKLPTEVWILLVFFAYIFGHIIQGIANLFEKIFGKYDDLVGYRHKESSLPETIINGAKSKISSLINLDENKITMKWLYRICDETIVQNGITEEREMYTYRKGFYRGLTTSFFILFLSLIFRMIISKAKISILGSPQEVNWTILLFFILISLIGFIFSWIRYERFSSYLVEQAILGFLVLKEK